MKIIVGLIVIAILSAGLFHMVFQHLTEKATGARQAKALKAHEAKFREEMAELGRLVRMVVAVKNAEATAELDAWLERLQNQTRAEGEPIVKLAALTKSLQGTSKNSPHRSRTTKLPPNDSALFPFRFAGVHASKVHDWH